MLMSYLIVISLTLVGQYANPLTTRLPPHNSDTQIVVHVIDERGDVDDAIIEWEDLSAPNGTRPTDQRHFSGGLYVITLGVPKHKLIATSRDNTKQSRPETVPGPLITLKVEHLPPHTTAQIEQPIHEPRCKEIPCTTHYANYRCEIEPVCNSCKQCLSNQRCNLPPWQQPGWGGY